MSLMQETSEYREREYHNPEPTGASNPRTELEAIAQFLTIVHAENALSERELAALVSSLMGDPPKPDKLTPSQRKRQRRQQSAEVSRQAKIKVSQQSAEVSRQEKIKVPQHRVEVRHDQNEENVSQRSGEMHLEEKEVFTPGHEPKGIPDILGATVSQQSVVMDLEEKGHFTPGHEPKVIPDAIIIAKNEKNIAAPAAVEEMKAGAFEDFKPGLQSKPKEK